MRENRPSRTASQVAQVIVYLGQDERLAPLLPAGLAEWNERLLRAAGILTPWRVRLMKRPGYRRFVRAYEHFTVPGQMLHLGLRKRCFEEETTAAIEDGATQVLVVGAGMDTLCLRLATRFPRVRFIEIDHPASQKPKARAVALLGEAPANLQFLPADLGVTPLEEVLAGAESWQREEGGVIVAEGVLMFLEEAAVLGFLEAVQRLSAPGSRLLFGYLVRTPAGKPHLGRWPTIFGFMLRMMGEPIRWHIRPDAVPDLLARYGFSVAPPARTDLSQRYLAAAGLADEPLGDIERLVVATRQAPTVA